ncbi:MAG: hypothetical protein JKY54_04545 [Flavobacteriales bacterium]|nr:hypothetical protein [Flavobacteriales bacterium]
MRSFLLVLVCLLIVTNSFGQDWIHNKANQQVKKSGCLTDALYENYKNKKPLFLKKTSSTQVLISKKLAELAKAGELKSTYSIPVVFHVVHNGGSANIPNSQIQAALNDLNEAFDNLGFYDPSIGVAVNIDFCLAVQDEFGAFSTGITNTLNPLTDLVAETQDSLLKSLIRWEPNSYLNIYVVNSISSVSVGSGVLGYAYLPSFHGTHLDGIVIEADYTGVSQERSVVLVHEVGHYLGLNHTFFGGCTNNNCLTDGDGICDTPPDASTPDLFVVIQLTLALPMKMILR